MDKNNLEKVEKYFQEGLRFLRLKANASAYEKFAAIIREEPEHVEAYVGLGLSLERNGKPHEAISMYKQAIKLDPKNAVAVYNLGVVYLGLKQNFKAWRQFKKTLKLQPDNPNALHNLGLLAFNKKKYKKAISFLLRAVAANTEKPFAIHYLLGKSFLGQRLTNEAYFHFRKSVELRDEFLPALFELFKLHQMRGEWLQLFEVVRKISRLCSNNQTMRNEIQKSLQAVKEKVDHVEGSSGQQLRKVLDEIEAELDPEHRSRKFNENLQPKVIISEPDEDAPRVYH